MDAAEMTELDVLAALRGATGQRHALLDTRTPMAAAAPDLQAYRAHLLLLRAWLRPMQAWLAGFDDGPPLRDYLRLIDADLAHPALRDLPAPPPMRDGTAPDWPPHAGAAWRWGVCYVVEGSQLGGAVLYKRHAQRLAPHPLSYLRGEGSPAPRWQQFIAAMRGAVSSPAQIAEACLGAQQAFDRLILLNQ